MTPEELLAKIRDFNVAALAAEIARSPGAIAEPALRTSDGELATDGRLALPVRVDLAREGDGTVMVDADRSVSFEPFSLDRGLLLTVHPFGWDYLSCSVDRAASDVGPSLREWYLSWFDTEDRNEPDSTGLFGVVHFASDPAPTGSGCSFFLDLGSAPVDAFDSLVASMSQAGVTAMTVSRDSSTQMPQ